ncbi:MAG: DUF4383 domain-containing protein [Actinomycetota bacterium]|nr:DUF4383 domain-containing protein [Actinomycetota bacterium]
MRREGALARDRTDIQRGALLFGIVFLVVTLAGFIPGITTNYDDLTRFDGEGAKIFGIFGTNILENIVHLLYGVAGLAAAASWAASKNYFIWGGVVYLAVWLYGLLGGSDEDSTANFLGLNSAADWLHFVLGVTMIAVGFLLSRRVAAAATA